MSKQKFSLYKWEPFWFVLANSDYDISSAPIRELENLDLFLIFFFYICVSTDSSSETLANLTPRSGIKSLKY